ncbi:MAG: sigma-70 family RNA polymerase sigma factor [Proteobacteria bacterium]|nr:sigma-70 family RNA polymerase sigma factor [Pseudomonadota bacterium]
MPKDCEIVENILKGEIEMYELLMEKYEGLIKSIIYGMVYNEEVTKDLTQEIFLKAYKKLKQYNPRHPFKSWLTRIAKNHAIDYLRRAKYNTSLNEVNPSNFSYADEDITLQEETKLKLETAMLKLGEENRMLLYLKYHENYSNTELSDIMNIPMKNIRLKIFRAKERLKKILEGDEYFKSYKEVANG